MLISSLNGIKFTTTFVRYTNECSLLDFVKMARKRVDEELDRIYKHPLKNRRIKILYQQWAIGRISWYNKKLDEYRVEFEDGTEDYINLDDVNGAEMILLEK